MNEDTNMLGASSIPEPTYLFDRGYIGKNFGIRFYKIERFFWGGGYARYLQLQIRLFGRNKYLTYILEHQ